jgi:dTDP-4-amino-4,6-dideoxygalactose transaminase
MIPVTKTYLPSLEKYHTYLEKIWESGWLTNGGVLVKELEKKLRDYLGVKHVVLVNNCTTALQMAVHQLGDPGEIITTPFSYVATTSAIVWERFTPVFADIDPKSLTIDPIEVERLITAKTKAILPVHVYGNPCDVEALEKISKKHYIPVIYDAAHAFGVKYKHKSISQYGDVSVFSFHATKLFHTIEGGALATNNDDLAKTYRYYRNFGHETPESFAMVGINGKMNEFSAAMGLSILDDVPMLIKKRKQIYGWYDEALKSLNYISRPVIRTGTDYNYAYYPVLFKTEAQLLNTKKALEAENIYPRRYFYPSLNLLKYASGVTMKHSNHISENILCLPVSYNLTLSDIKSISQIVIKKIG